MLLLGACEDDRRESRGPAAATEQRDRAEQEAWAARDKAEAEARKARDEAEQLQAQLDALEKELDAARSPDEVARIAQKIETLRDAARKQAPKDCVNDPLGC